MLNEQKHDIVPGTVVWVAPFYNRSGYGIGARTMVCAMHRAGVRIRIIPVNEMEAGIDDCDMDLIRSLEQTPIVPPVTNIITHVPSMNWFKVQLPDPHIRIMDTMFDSSAQGNLPPADWMEVLNKMDQVWLMTDQERNAFMAAGLPGEKIQFVRWPHPWMNNPVVPLPRPEPLDTPFRFLSMAMFLPRRRWDTLIEAYLEEFKGNDNVELYLKVNYPSWHPIPGKPRQDLHDLIEALRQKTGSQAAIIIDEELGTRLSIVGLMDSCNAYISTDTTTTAPVSEARVRQRMVIIPYSLGVGMPPDQIISVDPDAKFPLTEDMLLYQPHHKEAFMPKLFVKDVRHAMRSVFDMSPDERLSNSLQSASVVPDVINSVAEAIYAINWAWQYQNEGTLSLKKGNNSVIWEGTQFAPTPMALINRELSLQLIDSGLDVSIVSEGNDDIHPGSDSRFEKIVQRSNKPLSGKVDIHIRHQWPPNFDPPGDGFWIMIQSWEYGSLPKEWVLPMKSFVDEIWVPSHYVWSCFTRSGIPENQVHIIRHGVDTCLFNPDSPPFSLKTNKKYRFIFIGATIWRKGPDILLNAYISKFTAQDDVCLVIKDTGSEDHFRGKGIKKMIETIQEDPDHPEIEYIDAHIPLEEVPGLYTACHCLVLPYRAEGFGLPVAEAMACELPVIVTGYGAAADFCGTDKGYFIYSEEKKFEEKRVGSIETADYPWYAEPDVDDLARLMRHVYENADEASEKAKKARLYIETHHTWKHIGERVIERMFKRTERPLKKYLADIFLNDKTHDKTLKTNAFDFLIQDKVKEDAQSKTIEPFKNNLSVVWEGSQFVNHSLALVNRELCLQLIKIGCDLSITPYEKHVYGQEADSRFKTLEQRFNKRLKNDPDVHVRHTWPPNFNLPEKGHWVMIQPWEYGSLPKDWISPMNDLVDEIWVPSRFLQECFIKSGVSADHVQVIPNGVNTALYHSGAMPLALKTRKSFRFLFVGGTIWRKGPDILLGAYHDAFTADDDVCLVIKDMGGDDIYKGQNYKDKILKWQENPDFPEIEYIPSHISQREMPGLYTSCHCLVHPYRGEGFALPVAEAMACNLPVIVTGYGAVQDYCTDESAYFVWADEKRFSEKRVGSIETIDFPWYGEPDRKDLTRLMRHVFQNPAEAREKGTQGRLYIENHLTWNHVGQMVMERMKEVRKRPIKRFCQNTLLSADKTGDHGALVSIVFIISEKTSFLEQSLQQLTESLEPHWEIVFITRGDPETVKLLLEPYLRRDGTRIHAPCDHDATRGACYSAGLKKTSGEYLIFLDQNILFPTEGFRGIIGKLAEPEVGLVGPMMVHGEGMQAYQADDYPGPEGFQAYAAGVNRMYCHAVEPVGRLSAGCFGGARNVFDAIGGFDEGFATDSFLMEDLCLRIGLAGSQSRIAKDVLVHCYAASAEKSINAEEILRDKLYFKEKLKLLSAQKQNQKNLYLMMGQEQALGLWKQDLIQKSMGVFQEMVRNFPDDQKTHELFIHMLMDSDRFEDAIQFITEASALRDDIWKLERIAYCHEAMENRAEAQSALSEIPSSETGSPFWLNLKGLLAYKDGRHKEASEFFSRAMEADPAFGESCTNLAFIKWADEKPMEALDLFEKGFVLSCLRPYSFTNYHAVIKELRQYERGESVLSIACRTHPQHKRLRFLLIDLLLQQQKYEQAMNEIEDAIIRFGLDEGIMAASTAVREKLGPLEIPVSFQKNTISLCMIVKNEGAYLAQCLVNLKPVVNEMIVVDTGSDDNTKEIGSIFGARVFDFKWVDDFSEARNFSISKARGEWVLVMDADEIISHRDWENLKQLVRGPAVAQAYSFETRNYETRTDVIGLNANDGIYGDEEAGIGWTGSRKVRLFKNGHKIKFEGPVHEMVEPFLKPRGMNIVESNIPVHHYGKIHRASDPGKGEVYFNLGLKKLKTQGFSDKKALYELAVQAGMLGKWTEAVELWERLIGLQPDVALAYVNLATACLNLGDVKKAISTVQKALALDPEMKEAVSDHAFYQMCNGNAEKAVYELEGLMLRYPDFLSARFKLGCALLCAGRETQGMAVFQTLEKTELGGALSFSFHTMAETLLSLNQGHYARAILKAVEESPYGSDEIQSLLEKCRQG